jgi:chemotaxis signal transduction protein
MAVYKGIEVPQELVAFIKHMEQVDGYRESLQKLQAVWDNLALLGQLSGTGVEIGETRAGFEALSSRLLSSLADELKKKTAIDIGFRAQVAIDILVRNLFERTADIGFLAMDSDICAFAEQAANVNEPAASGAQRAAILERFREYVRKYSVYHDIILLAPDGRVLAQLDDRSTVQHSTDPLLAESLATSAAYVETYRSTNLLPGAGPALIYSYRVMSTDGTRPVGVLCLCFSLQNECERIFTNLRTPQDWVLLSLIDADGMVVASSDPQQLPPGARLEDLGSDQQRPLRFAGREYVAATRASVGYQGYAGPGWRGHVMVPLQHAYDADDVTTLQDIEPPVFSALMQSEQLFPLALREIPRHAEGIQADLNRAVWNGNVRLSHAEAGANGAFSKTLLWEIGRTGGRTRDVFGSSIRQLNETVVSSMLRDCSAQAALAIDIMDRNLYERANDCRWWALTTTFRATLSRGRPAAEDVERMCGVLSAINRLYTVYTDLLLFDREGRVVAVSNPSQRPVLGTVLREEWVARTLRLRDTQRYCVSAFERSGLYADRCTYIYCAAVRSEVDNSSVGGVAIVFDSEPQFAAMLADALPRDQLGELRSGSIGLFVHRDGSVIASTDPEIAPGSHFELDPDIQALPAGGYASMIRAYRGGYYAMGAQMSAGYREYKSAGDDYRNDVVALILVPLTTAARNIAANAVNDANDTRVAWPAAAAADGFIEVATFHIGESWYGLPTSHVLEALNTAGMIAVPAMPGEVAGMAVYGDATIPVYDLAQLRGARAASREHAQIVVVRQSAEAVPFGILVDALGEIPTLPQRCVQEVPFIGNGIGELLDGLVMPVSASGNGKLPMLMLLSVDRLCAQLRRDYPAEPLEDAAAVAAR